MARVTKPARSTAAQSNAIAEIIRAGQPAAAPELTSVWGSKLPALVSAATPVTAMATSTAAAALEGGDMVPGGQPEGCVTPELSTFVEKEPALPPEEHEAEAEGMHQPEHTAAAVQPAAAEPAAVDTLGSAAGSAMCPQVKLESIPATAIGFNRYLPRAACRCCVCTHDGGSCASQQLAVCAWLGDSDCRAQDACEGCRVATLEGRSEDAESEGPRASPDRVQTEPKRRSPRRKQAKTPKGRGRTPTRSTTGGPSYGTTLLN